MVRRPGHLASFYLSTLTASTEGRFVEVEENMAMAERTLDRMPVAPASVAMVSARAVQLHARGPAGRRAAAQALLPVIRRTLGTAFGVQQAHLVSVSQICLWAEDLDLAAESIDRLDALEIRPEWLDACVGWLRALLAEQHGDLDRAVAEHRSALAAGWSYLRLYEAHSHADLARVQQRLGRHDEASDSLARAREAYLRIGAQAFVDRIDRLQPQLSLLPGPPAAVGLTERERDVLLLALGGMSYRQIAQELFITQKTVGFHLSNLYGKTGVGSRHELADYARRHPQALGLAPDTAPRARPVRSTGTHRRTVPKT